MRMQTGQQDKHTAKTNECQAVRRPRGGLWAPLPLPDRLESRPCSSASCTLGCGWDPLLRCVFECQNCRDRQTSPGQSLASSRWLICLLLQAAVPARVRATPTCARACVTMAGPARLARLMLALACLACWCCAPAGALPSRHRCGAARRAQQQQQQAAQQAQEARGATASLEATSSRPTQT